MIRRKRPRAESKDSEPELRKRQFPDALLKLLHNEEECDMELQTSKLIEYLRSHPHEGHFIRLIIFGYEPGEGVDCIGCVVGVFGKYSDRILNSNLLDELELTDKVNTEADDRYFCIRFDDTETPPTRASDLHVHVMEGLLGENNVGKGSDEFTQKVSRYIQEGVEEYQNMEGVRFRLELVSSKEDGTEVLQVFSETLTDEKGQDILVLDCDDLSDVSDAFVRRDKTLFRRLKDAANSMYNCYRRSGGSHLELELD